MLEVKWSTGTILCTTSKQQSEDRLSEDSSAKVEDETGIEDIIAPEDIENKYKIRITRTKYYSHEMLGKTSHLKISTSSCP